MNDISGKISFYHNLFLVCLIIALICLTLATMMFFLLDIRSALGYLSGHHAKKEIKELEVRTVRRGRFVIVRELMLVHTEEVI